MLEDFVESTQSKIDEIRKKLSARSSTQTKSANSAGNTAQPTRLDASCPSRSLEEMDCAYSTSKVDSQATQKTSKGSVIPSRVKTISQHEVDAASPDIVPRLKIEVIKSKNGLTCGKTDSKFSTRTIVPDRSQKKADSNRSTLTEVNYRPDIYCATSNFIGHDPGAKLLHKNRFRRRTSQTLEQQSHSTIK